MKREKESRRASITGELVETACSRLAKGERVRRTLPGGGRLHIDRQLPFLCVYRQRDNDAGTSRLVTTEAAYLVAPGGRRHVRDVHTLVEGVVRTLAQAFGGFLLLEIWAGPDEGKANDPAVPSVPPVFRVVTRRSSRLSGTVADLASRLTNVKVLKQAVVVETEQQGSPVPSGLAPLLSKDTADSLRCATLGCRCLQSIVAIPAKFIRSS